MSNHAGSYMLNEVLCLLEKRGVFSRIGLPETQGLIADIVKRAQNQYDCNAGEILEEIGERLEICYICLTSKADLDRGICRSCVEKHFKS